MISFEPVISLLFALRDEAVNEQERIAKQDYTDGDKKAWRVQLHREHALNLAILALGKDYNV